MSEPNPLNRAHALSAQASTLINPNSTLNNLTQGLDYYNQACILFQQALERNSEDQSMKKTLEMLIAQHKRLIRDLERRIGGMKKMEGFIGVPGTGVGASTGRVVVSAGGVVGRVGLGSPRSEGLSLGLAGMNGVTGWVSPTGLGVSYCPTHIYVINKVFRSTITDHRFTSFCPPPSSPY